jgi:acyl dehydratase
MNSFNNYFEDFNTGKRIIHSVRKTFLESDNNIFSLLIMDERLKFLCSSKNEKKLLNDVLLFSTMVGFSVPDISWNAIANLDYEKVEFIKPVYIGDTIKAETEILNVRESKSKKDRGIVYVETKAYNQRNELVLTFRRHVLIPKKRSK